MIQIYNHMSFEYIILFYSQLLSRRTEVLGLLDLIGSHNGQVQGNLGFIMEDLVFFARK